jgi:hypothetical protein
MKFNIVELIKQIEDSPVHTTFYQHYFRDSEKIVDGMEDEISKDRLAYLASINGYTEIIMLMVLDSEIDFTYRSSGSFRAACRKGHLRIVQSLLSIPSINPADK